MPDNNLANDKNDEKHTSQGSSVQETIINDSQSSSSQKRELLWEPLGKGGYNKVWKSYFSTPTSLVPNESYQGPWVLKYPIYSHDDTISNLMNEKKRAVRIWNEVNDHLPKAGLYESGWVAPFFKNTRQPTDEEIALKLIDIYCSTRRIILDAATFGNFLTDIDSGEVILVDVDLALRRSNSIASIKFAKNLEQRFDSYWNEPIFKEMRPKTLEITRNLLYLEDYLSSLEIDELCTNQNLNFKSIQALTWLRTHDKKLTHSLFQQIVVLNESDIEVSNLLLEALSFEPKDENIMRNSMRLKFFSETSRKQSPNVDIKNIENSYR